MDYVLHMNRQHPIFNEEKKRLCSICGHPTTSPYSLKLHIRVQHFKTDPFPCKLCKKTFPLKENLTQHIKLTHTFNTEKNYLCDKCDKKFEKNRHLLYHKRNAHAPGGQFKCKYCGKIMKYENSLRRHLKGHESTGSLVCEECGKEFKNELTLRNHMKLHLEPYAPGGFRCLFGGCNKTFDRQSTLKLHFQKCHSDDTKETRDHSPFDSTKGFDTSVSNVELKCDQCGYTTNRRNHLLIHQKNVHEGLTFSCDVPGCSRTYNLKKKLDTHRINDHKL